MDESELDGLYDPEQFQVSWPLYVIAVKPLPKSFHAMLRSLARGAMEAKDRTVTRVVLLFTDADLAERHIRENHFSVQHRLEPMTFPTIEEFRTVLEDLVTMGETHVAIDPGDEHARVYGIERVLRSLPGQSD